MANSVQKPYIGISGIIGAGKTTLSKKLGEVLDLPVYLERIDEENGLLGDFYKDKKKYSFPLQIFLLNRRFEQQQQVIWNMSGGIQDRTIYEDGVFAKMLMESGDMEERDYQTYKSLFSNMSNFIKKPDIILHLDVTPEQAQERIRTRGRRVESDIPLEYLQSLHKGYEEFLYSISKTVPVIRVKWSTFIQAEDLAKLVSAELANLKRKTTDVCTENADFKRLI